MITVAYFTGSYGGLELDVPLVKKGALAWANASKEALRGLPSWIGGRTEGPVRLAVHAVSDATNRDYS